MFGKLWCTVSTAGSIFAYNYLKIFFQVLRTNLKQNLIKVKMKLPQMLLLMLELLLLLLPLVLLKFLR